MEAYQVNQPSTEKKYLFTKDRYRIYYEKTSVKNPKSSVAMVHGLSCNLTVWEQYAPHFLEQGYSTIAFDLRGHGKSDKNVEVSFKKSAYDLNQLLEKESIKDVILVANCFGVGVALKFYEIYPEKVNKMVFITPTFVNPLKYRKNLSRLTRIFYKALKTSLKYAKVKEKDYPYSNHNRDKKSRCLTLYLKNFNDNPIRTHLACFYQLIIQDDSRVLPKIKVPTLIIAAEKDHYTPLQISKMIPDSELIIVKNMDHAMMIRTPEKISGLIMQFLKK